MTDVADVAHRPARGRRRALVVGGLAAAALLVPAVGADAQVGGTFTGGPAVVTAGQSITLTATGCIPNVVDDAEPAAPQAAVQFTLSVNGGPVEESPAFPVDEQGNYTLVAPVEADDPVGTYVFNASCGFALVENGFQQAYDYDETVTITVVAPTTTTTAPSPSTTVRPPATTPIAPAARAAAATPRFTG